MHNHCCSLGEDWREREREKVLPEKKQERSLEGRMQKRETDVKVDRMLRKKLSCKEGKRSKEELEEEGGESIPGLCSS